MLVIVLAVTRPVEKRERSLQHSGPTWKAPMLQDVLYNLPFLRHSPRTMIEVSSSFALRSLLIIHCACLLIWFMCTRCHFATLPLLAKATLAAVAIYVLMQSNIELLKSVMLSHLRFQISDARAHCLQHLRR